MIYLLFGEMGIGKNFVGERVAAKLQCDFVDGDDFLTETMLAKVKAFKPFTKQELDEFMHNLIDGIIEIDNCNKGEDIVVAQALYLTEHRQLIVDELLNHGIGTVLIWIPVPTLFTHMKRLWSRSRGFMWVLYGLLNKLFFQKPDSSTLIINNRNESSLNDQLDKMFG